jgi:hypothetical protein
MIREVPPGKWRSSLEQFGREHRAWLANLHVIDTRSTVNRFAQIPLKSATASTDAVWLEFLDEAHSFCARSPCAVRIQQTGIGLVQALEMETRDGRFIRLAFRATALPEQLDGLAPGELPVERSPS